MGVGSILLVLLVLSFLLLVDAARQLQERGYISYLFDLADVCPSFCIISILPILLEYFLLSNSIK